MSLPITELRFCLSFSISKFSPFLPNPSSFSSFHSQPPSVDVQDVVSQFHRMFHMRLVPPINQFQQILGSLAKMEHYSTTISLFKQMEFKGIQSNLVILNIVINCLCHLSQMSLSFSVLAKILKLGYHPDVITLNTLIKGFCLNSEVKKAVTFYDKVGETGAAIKLLGTIEEGGLCNSTVVMALFEKNEIDKGETFVREMIFRGLLT